MKTQQIEAQIEEILSEGGSRPTAVKEFARQYLESSQDPHALFRVCEWYRRARLYREALRLVLPEKRIPSETRSSSILGTKALWAARLLNLLGSGRYAVSLLKQIALKDSEHFRIAAQIWLAQFEYEKASRCLSKLPVLTESRLGVLTEISRADIECGLGNSDVALQIVRSLSSLDSVRRAGDTLLTGIVAQAEAEYLARAGSLENALKLLEEARNLFENYGETIDAGFFWKWLGLCYAETGRKEEAKHAFSCSKRILFRPKFQEEAWLDLFRLMGECGLLPKTDQEKMKNYPGLSNPVRKILDSSPDPLIDHLNLEEKLLFYISKTSTWGLKWERAKAILWPDEVYSYFALDGRMNQLIWRLRNRYQMNLSVCEGVIRLHSDLPINVVPLQDLLPNRFRSYQIQERLGLGKTQSASFVSKLHGRGKIQRIGRGRATLYEFTNGPL